MARRSRSTRGRSECWCLPTLESIVHMQPHWRLGYFVAIFIFLSYAQFVFSCYSRVLVSRQSQGVGRLVIYLLYVYCYHDYREWLVENDLDNTVVMMELACTYHSKHTHVFAGNGPIQIQWWAKRGCHSYYSIPWLYVRMLGCSEYNFSCMGCYHWRWLYYSTSISIVVKHRKIKKIVTHFRQQWFHWDYEPIHTQRLLFQPCTML